MRDMWRNQRVDLYTAMNSNTAINIYKNEGKKKALAIFTLKPRPCTHECSTCSVFIAWTMNWNCFSKHNAKNERAEVETENQNNN